eukprot:3351563-Ditylum_brightwellii.AAC.1
MQFRDKLVLLQTIVFDYYDFQQLEAATPVDTEGKWFFVYKKEEYDEVTDFIDNVLPDLYVQIADDNKLEGYGTPFRQIRQETCTHCSYAEALKRFVEARNPQKEEEQKYDQPTERTCKRHAIAVVTEDFPDLADD